jgi:adenine-specific DNA methylase
MTLPRECKRLAEVDFPVAKVSAHSAREKSIRHGHPSTLHLWWARRPLAACRAMLMALLLPDPCDPCCPPDFTQDARRLLANMPGGSRTKSDKDLREALLYFIADFANWDNSSKPVYLECARGLVRAAHGKEPPLVVDPFAGGGSIPLEALRVGCDAFASDLNPVACLILKVLLEDIPRHGPGLADELRRVGKEIKEAAGKELAQFYPEDPGGARPIAYLWARTVRCESPRCGAEIPLMRSFWLCKKANRKRALRYEVVRPRGDVPRVEFEIFSPKRDTDVPSGTVSRAKATCLACGTVLSPERVRAQLSVQRGGADVTLDRDGKRTGGARLLAVVTLSDQHQGRQYRLPCDRDYAAVFHACKALKKLAAQPLANGLNPIPDESTPAGGGSGAGRAFSIQKYGMMQWGDLFTARQKLALSELCVQLRKRAGAVSGPVGRLLALAIGKAVDLSSSGTPWKPGAECPVHLLSSPKIPPLWDWAEAVLSEEASGSFSSAFERTATTLVAAFPYDYQAGITQAADALSTGLADESVNIWFTDCQAKLEMSPLLPK